MKEELTQIIRELKTICKSEIPGISQESVLENAIKIYLSNLIQENKQKNIQSIKSPNKSEEDESLVTQQVQTGSGNPATFKQINFLKKNKMKFAQDITKEEAKVIIKEFIENQENY